MAERRMFAKTIIDSDAFLDMPITARLLYYDLGMRADDDGFVNSPKKIMRMIGASQDDLNILIAKKFIIPFDNGVVVIKHWRIHNYIRKDTYNETTYKDQKALLSLDENKAYTTKDEPIFVESQRSVDEPSTQDSIGKDSIGKDNNNIYSLLFEETYKVYPRKEGKKKAYGCYLARLKEGYTEEELLTAAKKYAEFCIKDKRETKYIKLASTFFGVNNFFVDYLKGDSENEGNNTGDSGESESKFTEEQLQAARDALSGMSRGGLFD